MIIKFKDFNENFQERSNFSFFLFHGSNFGRVNECLERIIKYRKDIENIDVINMNTDDFKKGDLFELCSKISSPNIFGTNSILSIYLNNEKLNKEIIECLSNFQNSHLIIILRSLQLSNRSTLRSTFEKNRNFLVVPCYDETKRDKNFYISGLLKKEKINIGYDEINIISDKLSNDRLEIKNEIEKIIVLLKVLPEKSSYSNFVDFISESLEIDNTKFINDLVNGNKKSFIKEYNKFTNFGNDNIKLLTYLIDHLFRLMIVKKKMQEGKSLDKSMTELRPPVFFKYKEAFINQVKKFKEEDLNQLIKIFFRCKENMIQNTSSSGYNFMFALLEFFKSKYSSKIV